MSDSDNSIPSGSNWTEVHKRVGLAADVFGKYGDEILAVIRFNIDDQSKANDIFQDFFVSLVRKPIPPHIEDVRGYLYKAVTHDVIDVSRRTRNRRDSAQKYAHTRKHCIVQEDPRDVAIQAEETQKILQRRGHGLSTTDTAERMRLTKRTVSRYLSVAIKKIRQFVPKNGDVVE
jgi:DNA-directed RNA polymerase specialized sigma24 family protein